ncbi:MAG: stage III sporulation protein AF [Bacillota bacterium]
METLANWVKNLIFIILTTTFLMIFLPDGKFRKYVRVVMGFFILSIFLSPVAGLWGEDIDNIYNNVLSPEEKVRDWSQIEAEGEGVRSGEKKVAEEFYEQKISKELEKIIELSFPDYKQEVEVKIDQYFNLKKVKVSLFSKNKNNNVDIEPVEINFFRDDSKKEEKYQSEKIRIKNKISNIYQIPVDIIAVEIEK